MYIVSYTILIILVAVYFTSLNNYNTGKDVIDYPLRSFYHANLAHLIANSISFYNLSFLEGILGSKKYLFAIMFIWIVSSLLLYGYHLINPSRKIYTVGFSAIIFGLIVVFYSLLNQSTTMTLTRLIIIILPQLFVPNISHEGHICGIIAGFLYAKIFL